MTDGPTSSTPPATGVPGPGSITPKRARRRRALRLAATVIALCLGLGALEVGLRLSYVTRSDARADRDSWHEFDDQLGWRARRSWVGTGRLPAREARPDEPPPPPVEFPVRTNALGLRHDREVAPVASPGTTRVAFVGDSFVFGYGVPVEQGVVEQLERRARQPLEVCNLGTCAYGVDQMRLVVERQALALHPDLVLVGVIDQDFRRALRAVSITGQRKPRFVLDGDAVRLVGVPLPPPPGPGEALLSDAPPDGGSFLLWRLGELVERARVGLAGGGEGERLRWRLGAALLRDAARLCRERGVAFGVVLFPVPKNLAEGEPLRALLASLGPDVPVCDLYPAFASAPQSPPLFLDDGHPSARGHALAAEAIETWLDSLRR